MIQITQIIPANIHLLSNPAPDVFDHDINLAHLAGFLAQNNHFLAVAAAQGRAVGQIRAMVQHNPDAPPVLYIENLGVAEDYQRQGIARRLIECALAWGAQNGCDAAWVATELDNHPALGLYRTYESEPMQPVAYCQLALPR